jgi:dolichol-phosphate mannosyltransferase
VKSALVVIPTYNELDNITKIIAEIFSLDNDIHILIVDDNSPDGTAVVVEGLIPKFPGRLFLEKRPGKAGLGTAYIFGFRWALQRNYEYIFEMDADFSHPPKDISRLYDACVNGGADVAIGSRYCKGGKVVNWPVGRILMSYFASVYVRIITGIPVKDTTAGFVCFKRNVLETIDLGKIRFVGYAFQIEMKFAAWKLGFKLKEVPIVFTDRVVGSSKMSKGIFKEAVIGVLKMKWNSFGTSYRKTT